MEENENDTTTIVKDNQVFCNIANEEHPKYLKYLGIVLTQSLHCTKRECKYIENN